MLEFIFFFRDNSRSLKYLGEIIGIRIYSNYSSDISILCGRFKYWVFKIICLFIFIKWNFSKEMEKFFFLWFFVYVRYCLSSVYFGNRNIWFFRSNLIFIILKIIFLR